MMSDTNVLVDVDPVLMVKLARLWNLGFGTDQIAVAIGRDEAWVANRIELIKRWANRLRYEGEAHAPDRGD